MKIIIRLLLAIIALSIQSQVSAQTAYFPENGDIAAIQSNYSNRFYRVEESGLLTPRADNSDNLNTNFRIIRNGEFIGLESLTNDKRVRVDGITLKANSENSNPDLASNEQFIWMQPELNFKTASDMYAALTNNQTNGNIHLSSNRSNPSRVTFKLIKASDSNTKASDSNTNKTSSGDFEQARNTSLQKALMSITQAIEKPEEQDLITLDQLNAYKATLMQLQQANMDVTKVLATVEGAITHNTNISKLVDSIKAADLPKLQGIITAEGSAKKAYTKAAITAFTERLFNIVTPDKDKTDTDTLKPIHTALTAMNIEHALINEDAKKNMTAWLAKFKGILDATAINNRFTTLLEEAEKKTYTEMHTALGTIITTAANESSTISNTVKDKFAVVVQKLIEVRPQTNLDKIKELREFITDKVVGAKLITDAAKGQINNLNSTQLEHNQKSLEFIQALDSVDAQPDFASKFKQLQKAVEAYVLTSASSSLNKATKGTPTEATPPPATKVP